MRWTTEPFITKSKEIHGDKFDYGRVEYVNSITKIELVCNDCGYTFGVLPSNHFAGQSCKRCAYKTIPQNISISHDAFVQKSSDMYGDKFTILGVYKNNKTKIKIKCNDCGYIFDRRPSSHTGRYVDCMSCSRQVLPQNIPKSTEDFICDAIKTHGYMYDYSLVEYITCRDDVDIVCVTCGYMFKQNPSKHISGCGCPCCNFSKGEMAVKRFLDENTISYICQKSFDGCVNPKTMFKLRFDFYLPDNTTIIEYDGEHHHIPIEFFGGQPRFEEYVALDCIKNEYCNDNNLRMIRIPYWDINNICEILTKEVL